MARLVRFGSKVWLLAAMLGGSVAALGDAGCSRGEDPMIDGEPDGGAGPDGSGPSAPDADDAADAHPCTDVPFECKTAAVDAGADGGDAGAARLVPTDLRCTKLYACFSDKTVSADHREYTPAFTLFSDGAEKHRWVYLPPGSAIDTGGSDAGTPDEWVFPVGTMAYKEFKLNGRRVETRRVWKASETEWVYSVWRWSDDETSATLFDEGALVPNTAIPGHVYEIPSTKACPTCHGGHRDKLLSLDAWDLGAPGAKGVTLAGLKGEGRLSSWPHPTELAIPQDGTGRFDKAVSFYYNNCGFCHKAGRTAVVQLNLPVLAALPNALPDGGGGLPDGGAGIPFAETPIYLTAVGVSHANTVGAMFPLGTYKRITPGDASKSVLPLRDSLRDPDGGIAAGQMPPLVQRTVDDAGVAATRDWINALTP